MKVPIASVFDLGGAYDQIGGRCSGNAHPGANSRRLIGVTMNGSVPRTSRDIEQASRLLDVTNETQLQAFLRRLIDDVARRSGRALPAKSAQTVLAVVKKAAEQTLPTLAPAFGMGDGPAPRLGSSPVATAARVYGLELEGLSAEDRDFEIACQLVRFAEAAAHRAASSPASAPDAAAVRAAVEGAAREFAPGLVPQDRRA